MLTWLFETCFWTPRSVLFKSLSLRFVTDIFSFLDSWSGSKLGRKPAAAWRFPLTQCLVLEIRQAPSSSSSHSTSLSSSELIAVPNTNHLLTSVTGNIQGLNGHVSSLLGSSLYLPRFPLSFPPFCLSFDADFLSLQAAFVVSSVSFLQHTSYCSPRVMSDKEQVLFFSQRVFVFCDDR